MTQPTIALLTDNEPLYRVLSNGLPANWERCGRSGERLVGRIGEVQPDVVVADFTDCSSGGHAEQDWLASLQESHPSLSIVMVTDDDCPEPLARRAVCTDIRHVVRAPEGEQRIIEAVREALPERLAADSISNFEPAAGLADRFASNTPSLQWMLRELEIAAAHDVTILLVGETGVGKTYLARLIHEVSPRCHEPFVTVACGALPGELVESELFGHTRGAFTSAHADKDGKFVAAGRGTMLLDEIDVLELEQQVKLLRAIETGEFEPVGSNTTLTSQARLIVASNLELQPLVEQGRFRPDLYYRLNMLRFEIPPLRDRVDDVEPMSRMFVQQLSQKHGVRIDGVEPAVISALQSYSWPGNVRELENVLRRAVIFCNGGELQKNHLPPNVLFNQAGPANDAQIGSRVRPSALSVSGTLGGQMEMKEREIIRQSLASNNQSRTQTAKALGISRVTLYNKMRKYELV